MKEVGGGARRVYRCIFPETNWGEFWCKNLNPYPTHKKISCGITSYNEYLVGKRRLSWILEMLNILLMLLSAAMESIVLWESVLFKMIVLFITWELWLDWGFVLQIILSLNQEYSRLLMEREGSTQCHLRSKSPVQMLCGSFLFPCLYKKPKNFKEMLNNLKILSSIFVKIGTNRFLLWLKRPRLTQ